MAWRRSQKVRCISDVYESMALPPCVPYTPKLGGVLTVDTVEPYLIEMSCRNGDCVQLRFVELPNPVCDCMGASATFCSCRFKPLVENDQATDISSLVDAAAKVTLPKREDVKASGSCSATIMHGQAVLQTLRGQRAVLIGDRPSEALLTPHQLAALQGFAPHFADQGGAAIEACARLEASIDQTADEIARAFIRTYVIPLLVKRLGL